MSDGKDFDNITQYCHAQPHPRLNQAKAELALINYVILEYKAGTIIVRP